MKEAAACILHHVIGIKDTSVMFIVQRDDGLHGTPNESCDSILYAVP